MTQWENVAMLSLPGGLANWVTTLRFVIIAVVPLISSNFKIQELGLIFLPVVLLDLLDGFLARKKTDYRNRKIYRPLKPMHFLLLLQELIIYTRGIPGYLRYFFVLSLTLLRKREIYERKTIFGSLAAGIMFVFLLAAYFLPENLSKILLIAGTKLILISFSRSFVLQFTVTDQAVKNLDSNNHAIHENNDSEAERLSLSITDKWGVGTWLKL
jgi:hypothetical protein